jgi:uncharacterized protein
MRPIHHSDLAGAMAIDTPLKQGMTVRPFHTENPLCPNRHWVRNDAVATALFNALSVVFPHGEKFMIRSMKTWRSRVNAELSADIQNFIEQEAAHAREHGAMNDVLITAGYNVVPLENTIKSFVHFFRNSSDIKKLGVTMCIEHFTAIIAAELLDDNRHLMDADPELKELWIWHGVEEIEHKAVAFDVWQYATRDWSALRRYLTRTSLLTAVTISFLINRTRGQVELLSQDGLGRGAALLAVLRHGFGKGGIGRKILRPWLSFFRPNFHPWDHANRHLIIKGEAMLAEMKAHKLATSQKTEVNSSRSPQIKPAAQSGLNAA